MKVRLYPNDSFLITIWISSAKRREFDAEGNFQCYRSIDKLPTPYQEIFEIVLDFDGETAARWPLNLCLSAKIVGLKLYDLAKRMYTNYKGTKFLLKEIQSTPPLILK